MSSNVGGSGRTPSYRGSWGGTQALGISSLLAQCWVERGPQGLESARKLCLFPYLCLLSPFKQRSKTSHSSEQLASRDCFPIPALSPLTAQSFPGCFSGVQLLLVNISASGHLAQYSWYLWGPQFCFLAVLKEERKANRNKKIPGPIPTTVMVYWQVPQSPELCWTNTKRSHPLSRRLYGEHPIALTTCVTSSSHVL